jgi:hypothetical protein
MSLNGRFARMDPREMQLSSKADGGPTTGWALTTLDLDMDGVQLS